MNEYDVAICNFNCPRVVTMFTNVELSYSDQNFFENNHDIKEYSEGILKVYSVGQNTYMLNHKSSLMADEEENQMVDDTNNAQPTENGNANVEVNLNDPRNNDGWLYYVQSLLNILMDVSVCIFVMWPAAVMEECFTFIGKIFCLETRISALESTGGVDSQMKNKVQELKNKVTELNQDVARETERMASLEHEDHQLTLEIDRLHGKLDQTEMFLALNAMKITDLESLCGPAQVIHGCNGTLLWKIEGFQGKRQDAISGFKTALYSPHFFSSQFGYKMCAKIYMNGDGFGKGSHLSLFFVIMKGNYDALQSWPFKKKITMMLLDQGNGDHMIDAFHSDPQSSSFQRPRSDMNIASGSPLFMPLDSLKNHQYIKDDVMFIKVIVD